MRRWIAWAAHLYPRTWRDRYGEEFDALVEDAGADLQQLPNVAKVGMAMRLSEGAGYWKVAAALALAGGSLALAASYRQPTYISTAILRLTPVAVGKLPADQLREEAESRLADVETQFTGPGWILGVAEEPGMDLFHAEREKTGALALRDEIEQGDPLQLVREGSDLQVSFSYRDGEKARAVVNRLVAALQAVNESRNFGSRSASERLDLIEPANLPSHPSLRGPSIFLAGGSVGGFLFGLLVVGFRRHPRAGLRVVACTLAGMAAGGAALLAIREQFTARTVLRAVGPKDHAANLWKQATHSDQLCRALQSPRLRLDAVAVSAACRNPDSVFLTRIRSAGSESSLEISARYPDRFTARQLSTGAGNALIGPSNQQSHVSTLVFPKVVGVTHYRMIAIAIGIFMGLLGGVRWNFMRKTAEPYRLG